MLITTSIDLPGYDIVAVQGEVFGLTVRSRNIGAGCMAALRSLGGGEIPSSPSSERRERMSTGNGRQVVLLAGEPRGGGRCSASSRPRVGCTNRPLRYDSKPEPHRGHGPHGVRGPARGANAIVAMRFDSGSIGQQWSEICAYGTAVWVTPVSEAAQAQYNAMVASGELPHQQDYAVRVSEWSKPPPPPAP